MPRSLLSNEHRKRKHIETRRISSRKACTLKGCRKYKDIAERVSSLKEEIVFKIVVIYINNIDERHVIEAMYAYENKAEFWSRSTIQRLPVQD